MSIVLFLIHKLDFIFTEKTENILEGFLPII